MKKLQDMSKELFEKLVYAKKVSRVNITEEEFKLWLATIDKINSLPKGVSVFEDFEFSRLNMPSKLTSLLISEYISFDGTEKTKDLAIRDFCVPRVDGKRINYLTPSEFNSYTDAIAGAIKDNQVSLTRPSITTVTSVYQIVAIKDSVHNTEHDFIPIRLVDEAEFVVKGRSFQPGMYEDHLIVSFGSILTGQAPNSNAEN